VNPESGFLRANGQGFLISICLKPYYPKDWEEMDLTKVLEQLRKELVHLDAAILSLERLQAKATRRGRPPRLLAELRKAHAAPQSNVRRRTRRGPTAE
jgi:hypothetical protein